MPYKEFCHFVACPNNHEIQIMGEIGDAPYFCDEHEGTKYVRCAEEYCSHLWVFDYDHEVPSAPAKDALDWLCDEHEPREPKHGEPEHLEAAMPDDTIHKGAAGKILSLIPLCVQGPDALAEFTEILRREYGESAELLYRVRVWIDEAEELEAKLAKALKALKRIRDRKYKLSIKDGMHEPENIAREVLKEIGDVL